MKERGRGERKMNESEETEEIKKKSPSTLTCYKGSRPCPTVSQNQLDARGVRYTTPLPHPITHMGQGLGCMEDWNNN